MGNDDRPLTDEERAILMFERDWWHYGGHKDEAIRHRFHLPPTRYYQVLLGLLDRRAAWEFDPTLCKRLERLRTERRRRFRRDGAGQDEAGGAES